MLPREVLQTLGNNLLSVSVTKLERFKNFTVSKFGQFFEGFDHEIINFQELKYFLSRDFDKSLQIVR